MDTHVETPGHIAESIDWWDLRYTQLDEQLICPICRTMFVDPYSTDCGHTFCHECINQSMKSPGSQGLVCPIDRSRLMAEPQPAPFVVRSLLDEMEVLCPFNDRGCSFKGKRWLLQSHVNSDCEYVKVYCHAPCPHRVERKHFDPDGCRCGDKSSDASDDDNELEEAGEPQTEVASSSTEDISSSASSSVDSPEPSFSCPGKELGCSEELESEDALSTHCKSCLFSKLWTAYESQNKRITSLECENRALKKQVDVFQHLLRRNATELDSQILSEYERILRELRDTTSSLLGQQTTLNSLVADNSRINAEVSYVKGSVDSIRRQVFLLTQSQRRLSFFSSFQGGSSLPGLDGPDAEDASRKRGQQKL